MDYSTDPSGFRYVPELALSFQKALLPAMNFVLVGFPESAIEQRTMMPDLDRDIYYQNGRLARHRTAKIDQDLKLNFGSLPANLNIAVSTTHDIFEEAKLRPNLVSLDLTFSTRLNGHEDSLPFDRFMFSKSTQRFFDDLGKHSGLHEGLYSNLSPGEYLSKPGGVLGSTAFRNYISINNLNLPDLKRGVRIMIQSIESRIDLEVDEFSTSVF